MTLGKWMYRHSRDREAIQEFIELLNWHTNPFIGKNADRFVFEFKTQGIGLIGGVPNSNKVVREIILSVEPDFSNANLGPRLKIITANNEYIVDQRMYQGVIRNEREY